MPRIDIGQAAARSVMPTPYCPSTLPEMGFSAEHEMY